jgi:Ca2+-binding RTX toxin-like protein
LIQWRHLLADGGIKESLSPTKRKGKGLVRRTILVLATMGVMLLVAGGVAFAVQCGEGTCFGTEAGEVIEGTDTGETIIAFGGNDEIRGNGGGDVIDGGEGNDNISGDTGDDNLNGGPGDDYFAGGEGYDQCYGGPGTDTTDGSCETWVP